MHTEDDGQTGRAALGVEAIDIAIRIGLLALLAYWSWKIIAPFLTILMWSGILAVALYPLFDWLQKRLGRPKVAATLITLFCLLVGVAPVVWLGFGLLNGAEFLSKNLDGGISIPLPSESIKEWPLVGEQIYRFWARAVTDVRAQLAELAPLLKPIASWLLQVASNVLVGLIEFLLSIIVAGFLFCPGPKLVAALARVTDYILKPRGTDLIQLAGATIRNVSRGVIGVALLQSILAGVGFLVAGIPGAGVLAFASLVLGIVQIGPAILFLPVVIWSWMNMETAHAFIFTAYMVPVGLIDNFLRPMLIARGLVTPMPLIILGAIGGTIAYGIIGLFFGPIVLAVAWELGVAWMNQADHVDVDSEVA
jgi:predicted PurR-regulated permease PerM